MTEQAEITDRLAAAEQSHVRQERVTSMMMALLVIVGVVALFLGLIWLTNQLWNPRPTVAVELVNVMAGDATGGMDTRWDDTLAPVENLAPEDRPEELIPETEMVPPAVMETLAEQAALVDVPSPEDRPDNAGETGSPGAHEGWGGETEGFLGSGKQRGWILTYGQPQSLDEYARMLDFFDIELAMKVGENELVYVTDLASASPTRYSGRGSKEHRLHFGWQMGSPRRQADVQLLRKAGLMAGRRVVVQFFPEELVRELRRLELKHAGGRPADQIRVTRFGVRRAGRGYEFHVLSQTYRDGAA